MDKSWMSKNRLSREYILGVEAFMNFALQDISNRETMLCPCIECGCINRNKVNIVRGHLLSNGIDLTYRKWIWHGEGPTLRDFTAETDEINQDECSFNFDHPIDMVNDAYDEANDPTKFQKLLEDAEKPLYPGCVKFTRLSAVVKLYNLKAKHNWSDKSFNDLLTVMGDMLPHPNELPLSLYDAKKSLVALGMEYEKIHACPNDCILYRKEYIDCTSCPTCGVSRWKDRRKSSLKTLVPQKVLWYFPPIPRFQRMFRTKDISKDLTWHADNKVTDGYMRHTSDLFGEDRRINVHHDDVGLMCRLQPITYNCILVYICHMYKKIQRLNKGKQIRFVDPYHVGYVPTTNTDKDAIEKAIHLRANLLAQGLSGTEKNQIVLVPCNVGYHWILTIVDPHMEEIGLLDPLYRGHHDKVWKRVVELALGVYACSSKSKSERKIAPSGPYLRYQSNRTRPSVVFM